MNPARKRSPPPAGQSKQVYIHVAVCMLPDQSQALCCQAMLGEEACALWWDTIVDCRAPLSVVYYVGPAIFCGLQLVLVSHLLTSLKMGKACDRVEGSSTRCIAWMVGKEKLNFVLPPVCAPSLCTPDVLSYIPILSIAYCKAVTCCCQDGYKHTKYCCHTGYICLHPDLCLSLCASL